MMIRNNIFKTLIALWFVFLTWFLIFSYGHCADLEYFPMQQNENSTIVDQVISYTETNFDSENNYIFIYGPYASTSSSKLYYFFYFAKDSGNAFAEINSNQFQFSIYTTGQPSVSGGSITYSSRTGNVSNSSLSNILGYFQNLNSSLYDSSKSYVSNFRVYTSSNTETREVVLLYGQEEPTVNTGHATPPNSFEEPILATGSNYTLPREVPESPTINNYSWTVYNSPTIDNSTVESLLESLIDVVQYNLGYITTNISNEFDNLLTNIKGFFDYVAKTIQYYGGLIISNIQNGIETLYNNMVSLVEPIFDKVSELQNKFEEFADLFINPFDEEKFDEQIANCVLISQYDQLIENCEDIQEIFDYAEERDHFSLYIDFENPFADAQHKIITSEISFDWLVPLRSVYRPFLWVFTLVELFTGSMRLLGNIIGGKAK